MSLSLFTDMSIQEHVVFDAILCAARSEGIVLTLMYPVLVFLGDLGTRLSGHYVSHDQLIRDPSKFRLLLSEQR